MPSRCATRSCWPTVHPGLREGGLTLPARVRLLADLYRDWPNTQRPARPFYPQPGGLIPWADYESYSALCWLADDDPRRER